MGNTNGIVSGGYGDTETFNPAYRTQGLYASLQYLESPFHVRVSEPVVSNMA